MASACRCGIPRGQLPGASTALFRIKQGQLSTEPASRLHIVNQFDQIGCGGLSSGVFARSFSEIASAASTVRLLISSFRKI